MPRRDATGLFLARAHDLGMVIRVYCQDCRSTRFYEPHDIILLLGDREIDSLRFRFKCERCGQGRCLEVEGKHMTAGERMQTHVRRLKRIEIVRRPVWE